MRLTIGYILVNRLIINLWYFLMSGFILLIFCFKTNLINDFYIFSLVDEFTFLL
jgi:hypothetical protein